MRFPFTLFLFLMACSKLSLREEALKPVSNESVPIPLQEGLSQEPESPEPLELKSALKKHLSYLRDHPLLSVELPHHSVPAPEYSKTLEDFLQILESEPESDTSFQTRFWNLFKAYQSEDLKVTGYFHPVLKGSKSKTTRYSQPLYQRPSDLIDLDLSLFFPEGKKIRGRIKEGLFLPYDSRQDIDEKQSLSQKDLELCYVDPIDAFFLQIQGSGMICLEGGSSLQLNYAAQNGHPYEAIGKYLTQKIPLSEMSMQRIEAYLKTLSQQDRQNIFNLNPSYVFFKTSAESAITSLGIPATPGRTIAIDPRFFPKGALGLLEFEWKGKSIRRWVLSQDEGGAIKGPKRVDLFWGSGEKAKAQAGGFNVQGRLTFFAPKNPQL